MYNSKICLLALLMPCRGASDMAQDHASFVQTKLFKDGECAGRDQNQLWTDTGSGRRLKGPVFHIHINSHAGRDLSLKAAENNMKTKTFTRWSDVTSSSQGDQIAGDDSSPGYNMWEDGSYTDLEETFGFYQRGDDGVFADEQTHSHTMDEIGCGDNRGIITTAVRHPISLLLTRAAHEQNLELSTSCEIDNLFLRSFIGKGCWKGGGHTTIEDCVPLTQDDLEAGKARARNLDVIYVLEHFEATSKLACSRLGWSNCDMEQKETHLSNQLLRTLTPEMWDALVQRNQLGVELYEYMRDLSFEMLKADGLPVPSEQEVAATILHEMPQPGCSICEDDEFRLASLAGGRNASLAGGRSISRWQCR